MLDYLQEYGFQVEFQLNDRAILCTDLRDAVVELKAALAETTMTIEEIIDRSGGESKSTQRLRCTLAKVGWAKTTFTVGKRINGVLCENQSHEIDHVRTFDYGSRIALEIEWNNKDTFYDRDLDNFKRLHANGAISIEIIVTRGRSLHANMRNLVRRFLDDRRIESCDDLRHWGYEPKTKRKAAIAKRTTRLKEPVSFADALIDKFVADKFGTVVETGQ